jgi:hypothetical protein
LAGLAVNWREIEIIWVLDFEERKFREGEQT